MFVYVIFSFGGFVLQFQRFSSFDYRYIYKFLYIYIYTFKIDYNIFIRYKINEFFDDFLTRMNFHCAGATLVQATAKLSPIKKCGKFVNSENLGCQHNLKRPISGKATNTQPQPFSRQPQIKMNTENIVKSTALKSWRFKNDEC